MNCPSEGIVVVVKSRNTTVVHVHNHLILIRSYKKLQALNFLISYGQKGTTF